MKSFVSTDPQSHQGENTWFTPREIFELFTEPFDLDVCTTLKRPFDTAKKHYEVEFYNSLQEEWKGCVWCNPPYGKELSPFVDKFLEHKNGALLLFARMGNKDVQKLLLEYYLRGNSNFFFFRDRLKFVGKDSHEKAANAGCDSLLFLMGQGTIRFNRKQAKGVFI